MQERKEKTWCSKILLTAGSGIHSGRQIAFSDRQVKGVACQKRKKTHTDDGADAYVGIKMHSGPEATAAIVFRKPEMKLKLRKTTNVGLILSAAFPEVRIS
ncbi:malate dehydrogenase [Anopheles sinensis]|uniref:Malate dehydrogenase n=1 Tax=Anopheles sinensis TaxID=74873 RepID=A0A084WGS6_ANOSI|nr:malate dehydrogenase [Anopheles sinensis]